MTFHSDNTMRTVSRDSSFVITLAVIPSVLPGIIPAFG